MFSLFIVMLVGGLLMMVTAGVLFVSWNISDALDEVSGKKRKRQIEKLQKASMAIGATTSVFSTTQMFKDSKEEEEIADLIQNAHNTYTTDLASSGSIPTTSGQLDNEYSIVREVSVGVLKKSNIFVSNSVKILHEVTNLNKED